jgi:hypothetical protein
MIEGRVIYFREDELDLHQVNSSEVGDEGIVAP